MSEAPQLIGGPYKRPPDVSVGQRIRDERLRDFVEVRCFTRAPIPWPAGGRSSQNPPILCGELVEAVRTESAEAIAYHWGVSRDLVREWRKALGVPRFTAGTRKRWAELVDQRLTPESRAKGARASAIKQRLVRQLVEALERHRRAWSPEDIAAYNAGLEYLGEATVGTKARTRET